MSEQEERSAPATTQPPEHRSRQRESQRKTRKKLPLWDRVKFILLLVGLWSILVWYTYVQFEPIMPFDDALNTTLVSQGWLLVLAGLEFIRQVHYFISERSARYHQFWTKKVFGRFAKRLSRMNDWNRYRIARATKWLFWFTVLLLVLSRIIGESPVVALFQIPVLVYQALPWVLRLAFAFFFVIFQFVGLFWFLSRGGVDTYFPDDIETRFSDVKGQDSVLEKVKENLVFLENPESIEERGGYVPRGILLWGPPGTGKTLMGRAIAGETGRPFVKVEPGAFMNMFMGVGILKVKGLFRKLRKMAVRYGGVIVFFDEADALGSRGGSVGQAPGPQPTVEHPMSSRPACNGLSYVSPNTASLVVLAGMEGAVAQPEPRPGLADRFFFGGMAGGGGMGTLQALLTELSGLDQPRGFFNRVVRRALGMRPKPPPKYRILVIMATNMPQALDPALLRPGRIDRSYRVGYPSKEGRKATYQYFLAKVEHELTDDELDKLSVITPYATGASIEDLVNQALINAIQDGRESIIWTDIIKAKMLKSLGPGEDVEYIERERHAVAIHEACHAVAAYRKRRHAAIDIATIEKGESHLGVVTSIPLEEQFMDWSSEFESDLIVSLSSLAGERLFFDGDNSSGVSGDLRNATTVATLMEAYWGMGSTVASHAATKAGVGKPVNFVIEDGTDRNLFETELGKRVELRLAALLAEAADLIAENRKEVLAVAHALETNKSVTGEDIEAIIEGRQGPLLDGRAYHTPEFEELAEEYHEHALRAHKQHAKVLVPLPIFSGERQVEPVATSQEGDKKEN